MPDKVTITVAEFRQLIKDSENLEMLLAVIYHGASLSFDRKALYFSDSMLAAVIKGIDPEGYEQRLQELKEAE